MSDSDARDGVDPDHWQRNDYLPEVPTDELPVRPQQPPPTDVVQQQLRLLVQAVGSLSNACWRLDRSSIGKSGAAPSLGRAEELASQVAHLGGWSDSLLSVGTRVLAADGEYVVGEPEATS